MESSVATDVREELQRLGRALVRVSPLKGRKVAMLLRLIVEPPDRALDIGGDNGAVSLVLRDRGGVWSSADLTEETVTAIGAMVGGDVRRTNGQELPWSDREFDLVVIADLLEHLETDREFVGEVARVLAPRGVVIVNVPVPADRCSRWFRRLLGDSDAAHGHVRPGYWPEELDRLFLPLGFECEETLRYGGIFTELFDACITALLQRMAPQARGQKGTVLGPDLLRKVKKGVKMGGLLRPFTSVLLLADRLVPERYRPMMAVRYRKRG